MGATINIPRAGVSGPCDNSTDDVEGVLPWTGESFYTTPIKAAVINNVNWTATKYFLQPPVAAQAIPIAAGIDVPWQELRARSASSSDTFSPDMSTSASGLDGAGETATLAAVVASLAAAALMF